MSIKVFKTKVSKSVLEELAEAGYVDMVKGVAEYTSFINIRPKQGNFQMGIKDEKLRQQIKAVVDSLID